jgi:glycerophosphoryl diester phosphodiesterase
MAFGIFFLHSSRIRSKEMLQSLIKERTITIAHRGARSLAPENTLAAARKAARAGADMWETDVRLTSDGEPVLIHDHTPGRTSNVLKVFPRRIPWRVCDFTLEELGRLDFGSWFQATDPFGEIAAGAVSREDLAEYRGERVPTLREAMEFTALSRMTLNIEIKDLSGTPGHLKVAGKVARLILEMGMEEKVIVSSFNREYLKDLKRMDRRIQTGLLVQSFLAEPESVLGSLEADAYHPRLTAIDFADISRLRRSGYEVFVWVVNHEEIMQRLIEAQASGIFTDFPQRLSPLLRSSPHCREH